MVSKYSLSILSGELSLLDLDAIHVYQFAEWTDGIRALGRDGGAAMAHKESLDKIKVSEGVVQCLLTCIRFLPMSRSKCACWILLAMGSRSQRKSHLGQVSK